MPVIGVDEAGRGSLFGPLVFGFIRCPKSSISFLQKIGVKDSKKLSPSKRQNFFNILTSKFQTLSISISAKEITNLMDKGISLNEIEAMYIAQGLDLFRKSLVFVDSPDRPSSKFSQRINKYLKRKKHIVSENHADDKYSVVSAASIIAKVLRDNEISKISLKIGNFGSGYPSDKYTRNFFLKNHKNKKVLQFVRLKWKTLNTVLQTKITD